MGKPLYEFTYTPREAFIPLHNRAQRWAVIVAHRRAGKTVALVNDLVIGALEEQRQRPQFAYIAPTYAQAKRTAWQYLTDFARPFMKGPPNETELRIDLLNNGRIFLAGADNPDSLRGLYLDGAILDEFAQFRPEVLTQIIRPALSDRNGWAVISGTPMGKNHFHDVYRYALDNPNEWFTMMLRASESGILPPEELAEMKAMMDEDEYLQEMECDFSATAKGMILARQMERADAEGRINDNIIHDPTLPLYVSSDIGFRDAAAWWFWQPRLGGGYNVVDFDEDSGLDAEDWIDRLSGKFKEFDTTWLPHDARAKTFATKRSALEQFMAAGHRVRLSPKVSTHHKVNAARFMVQFCHFNKTKCAKGLEHLRNWKFKFDETRKVFSAEPDHDLHSHGGDAWAYTALVARPVATKPTDSENKVITPAMSAFTLDRLFSDREVALANQEWR